MSWDISSALGRLASRARRQPSGRRALGSTDRVAGAAERLALPQPGRVAGARSGERGRAPAARALAQAAELVVAGLRRQRRAAHHAARDRRLRRQLRAVLRGLGRGPRVVTATYPEWASCCRCERARASAWTRAAGRQRRGALPVAGATARSASTSPATRARRDRENFADGRLPPLATPATSRAGARARPRRSAGGPDDLELDPEEVGCRTERPHDHRGGRRGVRRPDRRLPPAAHRRRVGGSRARSASGSRTGCWCSPTRSAWCLRPRARRRRCAASSEVVFKRPVRDRRHDPRRGRSTARSELDEAWPGRFAWRVVNQRRPARAAGRGRGVWRRDERERRRDDELPRPLRPVTL